MPAKKAAPAADTATPIADATHAKLHAAPAATTSGAAAPAAAHAKLHSAPAEVEPINLLESAGPAVAKRLIPVVALVVFILIVLRLRRR